VAENLALCESLHQSGHYVSASPLESVAAAVTVRIRSGTASTTDGPYAETKEQMGGFWVVEAPDLDAALDWAAKAAAACEGPVELRPTEYA
jgi:hypothetical protein